MSEQLPKKRRKTAGVPIIKDPRFANIQSDPRYRLPGKSNKVKLDKRFSRALTDEDFTRKAKVDRYGRPLETDADRKRLKRKYEFAEDEHSDGLDDDVEGQNEWSSVTKSHDLLRQGRETESSSEESSSEEDSDMEADEEAEAQVQIDVPMGEVTSRIAVVNLDWDHIRAADLMAVFKSFLPSTGSLLKVSIYPSEFGQERMEREEMEGPPKEIFATSTHDGDEVDEFSDDQEEKQDDEEGEDGQASIIKPDDGSEFDSTALRRYQLERLRYFYAILTFSSPSAAKSVYDAVDGTEYLSTANFFDLRFVPEGTDFSSDTPREECDDIPADYRPNEFVTDALQHSKVKLTWDAEDGGRKEAVARAFKGGRKEIDENDLKAYLGSDTSEDEDDDHPDLDADEDMSTNPAKLSKKEAEKQKMRALLGLPVEGEKSSKKEKGPVGGVQITFTAGLSASNEDGKKKPVFENSPEPDETTVEKYVRKERERKQRRRERMKASHEGAEAAPQTADSGNAAMATAAEAEEDPGFDDPFFAEPERDQAPQMSSKKMRKEERLKKKKEREAEEEADRKQRAELELLILDDREAEAGGKLRHFDMKEIEKAEKEARKPRKKQRGKETRNGGKNEAGQQDDFQVDTADPRFARLFENHEYAIDPTNPRFKGTKGMKVLLEEGRKRKVKNMDKTGGTGKKGKESKGKNNPAPADTTEPGPGGKDEVKSLVEKIKGRSGNRVIT